MNARRAGAIAAGLLLGLTIATAALAQKQGGILRVQHRDSPASMSIHEEGTISAIVPGLATNWSWSEDGSELTFKLRDGVKWHDGNPFSAADVKCTYKLANVRRRALVDHGRAMLPRPACGERVGVRGVFATEQYPQVGQKAAPHPVAALRAATDLSPQAGRGDWLRGQFFHRR